MAAKKNKTDDRSIEDRVAHLENTLHRFLTAHGETYTGALEDRDALQARAASDDADEKEK